MSAFLPATGRWLGALVLIAAPLLASFSNGAQNVNTTTFAVAGTGNQGPYANLLPTTGGWLALGNIRFRNDSTVGSRLRLSPDLQITGSRQYTLTRRATILTYGPFLSAPAGLVARVQAPTGRTNCMFDFDTTFAVRWGVQLLPNIKMQALAPHGRRRVMGV
ncbi:MAG: hypothetical protein H7330_08115 [Hymenobacteraceae bacterium]|nr:hypothetical protein [Hymenobacteraceae bacterium]